MSLKHNKKKNARIVYEQLMTLATRLSLSGHPREANQVLAIVKEHFKKGSMLLKEKKLFDSILETVGASETEAAEILFEALEENKKIPEKVIEKERMNLINDIISRVGKDLFSIPIKEYKLFASSQILLNESRTGYETSSPKDRAKIKNVLKEHMMKPVEAAEDYEMDDFTFKILKRKFDEKYSSIMNEDQKDILTGYMAYLMDNDAPKMKKLLENKVRKAKEEISYGMINEAHVKSDYSEMLMEARRKLDEEFSLNEESVLQVMKYFDLVEDLREFREDGQA